MISGLLMPMMKIDEEGCSLACKANPCFCWKSSLKTPVVVGN